MDSSLSKNFKTSRGFNYHYYPCAPDRRKGYYILRAWLSVKCRILGTSKRRSSGTLAYGILVPDLLGFGETDKPTDTDSYRFKYMVVDISDLLEHEKVEKVIAIGHDWYVLLRAFIS